MKSLFGAVFFFCLTVVTATFSFSTSAQAQDDVVWIQVEAHPSLTTAQNRARLYSAQLPDVNGFSLGGSWYGILIGPYQRSDAEVVLRVYREQGQIPRDSFISLSRQLGQQFWPVGADVLNRGAIEAPVPTPQPEASANPASDPASDATTDPAPEPAPEPELKPADETPAQARRSERDLSSDQRKDLQIALKAAGFYTSLIDGAFGKGTRRSMADWQQFNLYEPTGVLTTAQRKVLMDQYNAPLISVGMDQLEDTQAGIALPMPLKAVKFSRYEAPFAHYDSISDDRIRVMLISQPGDQATLFGLYDILQTLEILPADGERSRAKDRFTIEGRGNGIVTHAQARLQNGEVKGFILVWPEGDNARRSRVLTEMTEGFERLDGVLDPAAGADAPQNVDLVSGLKVRKPRLSRSGFYVDSKGTVVTSTDAVRQCGRITLEHDYDAEVIATDDALGLAILKPKRALAPMAVAAFQSGDPRLGDTLAVAGYSYGGVLGAATLSFGTLADVKGLTGDAAQARLTVTTQPADAGGPVLDAEGSVWGMLLPAPDNGQQLPRDVGIALDADAITKALTDAGITPTASAAIGSIAPDELSRLAIGMTVLVGCWD